MVSGLVPTGAGLPALLDRGGPVVGQYVLLPDPPSAAEPEEPDPETMPQRTTKAGDRP